MANKKSKLGVISAVAAGTGTAIYLAQKAKKEYGDPSEANTSISGKNHLPVLLLRIIIAIQNVENMTATVKGSIIPTETMKHLPILKNRKVLMKNMPIL